MEPKRLYRSLTDRKIAGVAGGLAEYFDTDPLLLRLAFVVLLLAGGGGLLIYIILWIVTPEKPFSYTQSQPGPASGSSAHADPFSNPDPFKTPDPVKTPDPPKNPEPPKSGTTDPFSPAPQKVKGSLIGGLVLITLGVLFLINQLVPNVDFGDLWPVILVVIGGGLLYNAFSGKK